MIPSNLERDWEFNTLNIYNFNKHGIYDFCFSYLKKELKELSGDILEAGVYRGRMTIALGLFLKKFNQTSLIHGFDSFQGFPSYSIQDQPSEFENLLARGQIDNDHYRQIVKLRKYLSEVLQRDNSPLSISSSGNFEDSRYEELIRKIDFLGLDNIKLYVGPFKDTMMNKELDSLAFKFVFLDCDLYSSYCETLNFAWPKLVQGGIVVLDEFYSLKFPGARVAVLEFFKDRDDYELVRVSASTDDFERYVVIKQ